MSSTSPRMAELIDALPVDPEEAVGLDAAPEQFAEVLGYLYFEARRCTSHFCASLSGAIWRAETRMP